MIEVHLVRLELPAAVDAWDAAEIPQELDHAGLPDSDALQFEVPIPSVVLDVVWPLAWSNAHDQL